jgi:hypothetical protein
MNGFVARSLERRTPLELIRPYVLVFDRPLLLATVLVMLISIAIQYSAGFDFPGRFEGHVRNLLVAIAVMWAAALVPPNLLRLVGAAASGLPERTVAMQADQVGIFEIKVSVRTESTGGAGLSQFVLPVLVEAAPQGQ